MENFILTPNCRIVLDYLYRNDETFVGKDLIDLVNIKGIYPVLKSLCDKGLVSKQEPIVRDYVGKDGRKYQNEYKTYRITDSGRSYVDSGLNNIITPTQK